MGNSIHTKGKFKDGFGLSAIFRVFWGRILTTWVFVILENMLIAFIPFLIGLAIDGLLAERTHELWLMVGVLISLGVVSVGRRIYDTRAYGAIRVQFGLAVDTNNSHSEVSTRNARLDMSRELVDFLEHEAPELLTSIIQIIVSLGVLFYFHVTLGLSSITVIVGMLVVYGLFHRRFFRLNGELNQTLERQVTTLSLKSRLQTIRHLRTLRKTEVKISDTEAILYGGIFLLQIGYIAFNLYIAADLPDLTSGRIFSIATYSWEYVEAALALPMALQSWSRLSEITQRLN